MKTLLISLVLALTATAVGRAAEINVSAAISLQEAVTQIAQDYKKDGGGGDNVAFTFGSSGQLATQIREGADVDIFISAANKQVDDLEKAHLTLDGTRSIVTRNTLVLIVPAVAKDPPRSFADLADTRFRRIAIGDPKTVPAGEYALQTLTALKLGNVLRDRLEYGTNVRQVLTYVQGAEVAAGIVYETDARQAGDKVKVVATADEKTHAPIVYPAVVVKASKKKDAARRFLDYLQTEKAQKVFTDKGFVASTSVPATKP